MLCARTIRYIYLISMLPVCLSVFFPPPFSCFLSLLLVAAVVWKIKQTCWASRRREVRSTGLYFSCLLFIHITYVDTVTKSGGEKHPIMSNAFPKVVIKSFIVKPVYTIKTTMSAISLCFALKYAMLIILIRGSGKPISVDSAHLKQRRLARGTANTPLQHSLAFADCFLQIFIRLYFAIKAPFFKRRSKANHCGIKLR